MLRLSVLCTIAAVLSVLLMALVSLIFWIWNPPNKSAEHVDAVVVLAYGQDRLKLGRELVESGVSDELVISVSARVDERIAERSLPVLSPEEVGEGLGEEGPWVEECGADYGSYQVDCVYPDPNSTKGEAIAVERLMEAHGWGSVMVVTERSHLRRALSTFGSCTSGTVYGEHTSGSGAFDRTIRRTANEMAATVRDLIFRTC